MAKAAHGGHHPRGDAALDRRAAAGELAVVMGRLGEAHGNAGADGGRQADQEGLPGILRGEGGREDRRERRDRAIHQASKARLHAATVPPVVSTSPTRSTRLLAIASPPLCAAAKVPARLRRRAEGPRPPCDGVRRLRTINTCATSLLCLAEILIGSFTLKRKNFIGKNNVALILGDNFFYGENLTKKLKKCVKLNKGAQVILHWVSNPSSYGVAKINNKNKIVKIIEKPKKAFSNLAVTGLYFFDNNVINYCENLKPSKRNEIEIVDLLNKYKKKRKLSAEFLGRGGAWLDTGSIKDFYNASAFVAALEKRQGLKIACLEEIAFNNKWIKKKNIVEAIKFYGKCNYSNYLSALIKKS